MNVAHKNMCNGIHFSKYLFCIQFNLNKAIRKICIYWFDYKYVINNLIIPQNYLKKTHTLTIIFNKIIVNELELSILYLQVNIIVFITLYLSNNWCLNLMIKLSITLTYFACLLYFYCYA